MPYAFYLCNECREKPEVKVVLDKFYYSQMKPLGTAKVDKSFVGKYNKKEAKKALDIFTKIIKEMPENWKKQVQRCANCLKPIEELQPYTEFRICQKCIFHDENLDKTIKELANKK